MARNAAQASRSPPAEAHNNSGQATSKTAPLSKQTNSHHQATTIELLRNMRAGIAIVGTPHNRHLPVSMASWDLWALRMGMVDMERDIAWRVLTIIWAIRRTSSRLGSSRIFGMMRRRRKSCGHDFKRETSIHLGVSTDLLHRSAVTCLRTCVWERQTSCDL